MPERAEDKKLNPQIRTVDVGKKDLREVSIYPLSMMDQMSLSDLISEGLSAFFEVHGDNMDQIDPKFIAFAIGLIKKNIGKVADAVTGEGEEILGDITNLQLSEIVEIVYKENYDTPVKNVLSLFQGEEKEEFLSERPLPQSAKSTDTGSKTSIKRATVKAD